MRLLLFDVDGTLCESGQKISPEMAQFLRIISVKHTDMHLAVVGGGTYKKIKWQLSPIIGIFTYIMAENGLTSYNENGQQIFHNSIRNQWTDPVLTEIIDALMEYTAQIKNLPVKTGNFIDLRNGLIYYCPIGQNCSQQDRQKFVKLDGPDYEWRINMIHELRKNYLCMSNLEMSLGGQLGISISPRGWDKSFIQNIVDLHKFKDIYFLGDKLDPYGSDEPIKKIKKIKCFPVKNWEDALDTLETLFS